MVQTLDKENYLALIDNNEISRNEFGYAWGSSEVTITKEIYACLKDGTKTLAHCDGEYVTFITVGNENRG